jgi:hypothetical protein
VTASVGTKNPKQSKHCPICLVWVSVPAPLQGGRQPSFHSWHPNILCSAKSLQNDWELVKILQTLLSLAKFSQILAFCKW